MQSISRRDAAPASASTSSSPPGAAPHHACHPQMVGRYLVSPLVKLADNGWFATSVSIRSGSGSATTDRVLRLTRLFRCAKEAASYAHAEALNWIGAAPRYAVAPAG